MFDDGEKGGVGRKQLLTLQIIVGAMVIGCLFFLAITLILRNQGGLAAGQGDLFLTYIAIAFAVGALIARLVAPAVVTTLGRRRLVHLGSGNTADSAVHRGLFLVFQTKTIVACAIFEGAAFFALIVYLMEGSPLALILAVVLILGIACHMPTSGRVSRWIDEQVRKIDEERLLAR